MAWIAPRTWVTGEVVTSALFNAHVRDNLTFALPGGGAEETFAPDLLASVTPPTMGTDSTITGRCIRIGSLVMGSFSIYNGTADFVDGDGNYIVNLPVPPSSTYDADETIGTCVLVDGDISYYFADLLPNGTMRFKFDGGDGLTGTISGPFTWEDDCHINGMFQYVMDV